jgi:hypothetical protein
LWYIFVIWASREALVHPGRGLFPAIFIFRGIPQLAELSIFIDESGDFGPYEHHSPYYILSLVFHNQDHPIAEQVVALRKHLAEAGFPEHHNLHTAPLIRRERDYALLDIVTRRKLFHSLFSFLRQCPIAYETFLFRKSEFDSHDQMLSRISRVIGRFVSDNLSFFQSFDKVIVYYDNGRKEVTNIINTVFNVFLDAEVRKVSPSDYCLFQAADMICTLRMLSEKLCKSDTGLSRSELEFFRSAGKLRRSNPILIRTDEQHGAFRHLAERPFALLSPFLLASAQTRGTWRCARMGFDTRASSAVRGASKGQPNGLRGATGLYVGGLPRRGVPRLFQGVPSQGRRT